MASEAATHAVEARFTSAVEELERSSRPVLKAEFECSARCAGNTALSTTQFQECVTRCGAASQMVGQSLNHEISLFQVGHAELGSLCQHCPFGKPAWACHFPFPPLLCT
jgi:hypothetical protein